jgi:hypothetical protein
VIDVTAELNVPGVEVTVTMLRCVFDALVLKGETGD